LAKIVFWGYFCAIYNFLQAKLAAQPHEWQIGQLTEPFHLIAHMRFLTLGDVFYRPGQGSDTKMALAPKNRG